MTAKELKASILDLAVRGKLVPQDPNDEPASVLLEKIRAEKQKLVKAGKIKKEKNPSEIYIASDGRPYEKFADGSETCIEDEVPFELPKGWAWARLGVIGRWGSGATPNKGNKDYFNGNIPWLLTGDLTDGHISSIPNTITKLALDETSVRLNPVGSVLIAMYGATIGKLGILDVEATTNQACCACQPYVGVYNEYLFWFLFSQREQFRKRGEGGAQPNISKEKIVATIFPLPPLSEQHRIVAKIEELMTMVGEYAKAAQQLAEFEAKFPADLRKAILQSAVEGKLVPQGPNDEPVESLLERINAERKALVKAGKIKRDKHESVIFRGSDRLTYETRDGETVCIEDELPFKIPENWAWVRLGAVATIIRGSGIKRDEIVPVGVPCIRYGELYTTYRTQISAIVSHTTEAVARRAKPIKRGDVILTLTGENKEDIGTAAAYLVENDAVVGGDVAVLKDHHCDPLWLSYFLAAPFAVGQKAGMSNGDIIVHLAAQSVASILVPLPPLAEQKRIVVQIEKMLKASATLTT